MDRLSEIIERLARIEEKINRRDEVDDIERKEQVANDERNHCFGMSEEDWVEYGKREHVKGVMINGVMRYSEARIEEHKKEQADGCKNKPIRNTCANQRD